MHYNCESGMARETLGPAAAGRMGGRIELQSLTVLLVDDEPLVRAMLSDILESLDYEVLAAGGGEEALSIMRDRHADVALLDYTLPDTDGIALMRQLKDAAPGLVTMIITGHGSVDRVVEAMQAGAWDFLTKPVPVNILREKLERIKQYSCLRREQDFRRRAESREFEFPGVIGPSSMMLPVYEGIIRAAQSHLPTLIEGPTGSGKEYIAQAVHLNSRRAEKPFVVLDCTATPESLIEATLFGSAKGAFTGAVERKGLLEEADGGTLFMDEIGEISLSIQPKLLRCLETKRFRPVGKTKEVISNFRIICATNRDLKEEIRRGNFRSDLFYRISAQKIVVPPLDTRKDDIPALANSFLMGIAGQNGDTDVNFAPEALARLARYEWPGNIRELKFVVESAFFNRAGHRIEASDIHIEDLPPAGPGGTAPEPGPESPGEWLVIDKPEPSMDFKSFRELATLKAERIYITSLLEQTRGDVRRAAEIAGMTREALYRVMSRCEVSAKDFRA